MKWYKKINLFLICILLTFVIGGIRVAILAAVVANKEVFDYFHGPEGGSLFSTFAIVIFGICCNFLLQPSRNN